MAVRYEEGIEDGLTEGLVCSLERPEEAEDLTEAERAAIAYADLMATNHLAIDEAVFDRLREHFSEAEIVELCLQRRALRRLRPDGRDVEDGRRPPGALQGRRDR